MCGKDRGVDIYVWQGQGGRYICVARTGGRYICVARTGGRYICGKGGWGVACEVAEHEWLVRGRLGLVVVGRFSRVRFSH